MRRCGSFAVASCALLVACVPAVKPPPKTVDAIRITTQGGGEHCCIERRWWTRLPDPALEQLLQTALADNPGLAEARARVQAADAEVSRAGATLLPHIGAGATVLRGHNSNNGNLDIYNGKTFTLGVVDPLIIDYHLDLWGQDREQVALAGAQAEVVRAQRARSELLLSAAVIKTYFAWQTAEHLVNMQQELVAMQSDALDISRIAAQSGVEADVEITAREAQRDASLAGLTQLRQRAAALHYALLALLGKSPGDSLPSSGVALPTPESLPLPATIGLDALAARPDIQIALWRVRAAEHQQRLARIAYYPNINLRALGGFTSLGLSKLFYSDSGGYVFGPAVSLPLFQGGALDANLQARSAALDAAIYAYNQAVLDAAAQVATDLASLDNRGQDVLDRGRGLADAERLAGIADTAFRSGVDTRLRRVLALIRRQQAAMSYESGKLSWIDALADTATDLGGGMTLP